MIKCCIFDLDGTLLETLVTIRYYVNNTLAAFGVEPITEEECRVFVGKGARNLIHRVLESRGVDTPEFFDKVFDHYNAAYDAEPCVLTVPYSGISELIDALAARGVRLAVVSNKPDPTVKQLCRRFFGEKIALAIGGSDELPLKPDPRLGEYVLSTLGVRAEECAVIGDSEVDVAFGRAIGASVTVGVSWGFRSRELLLSHGAPCIVDCTSELSARLR